MMWVLLLVIKKRIPLIYNRIEWWITYLSAWKFIEKISYWVYKITKKWLSYAWKEHLGKEKLEQDSDFINSDLQQKPKTSKKTIIQNNTIQEETPQDTLNRIYEEIDLLKKKDLLEYLKEINPYTFEKVVWTLCEAMWYWRFLETSKSHDWWIDWIIKWDALWFEKIYIQAKRYWNDNQVQWKEMQNFVWALAQTIAKKWVFFTTSLFSDNAKKIADNALKSWQKIVLIDWMKLVDLMFQYNIGVQTGETYEIKYIDTDFFEGLN